jgi:chromosome segregation ATPase
MAPAPDSKLLELLQRAADELKTAQRDATTAQAELEATRQRLGQAELSLEEERRQRGRLQRQLDEAAPASLDPGAPRRELVARTLVGLQSPIADRPPREEKTSVGGSDDEQVQLLGDRVKGLESEVQQLEGDRRDLKARLKALEAELAQPREAPETARKLGELEHDLANTRQQLIVEQARGADLLTRLQAWEARAQALEHALEGAHGTAAQEQVQLEQLELLAGQLSQAETELTTERARTQALEEQLKGLEQGAGEEQQRLLEATSRVAQLEVEVAGLRGRRDELNLEIGKVENERNAARARVQELEHAAQRVGEQLAAEHAVAHEAEGLKRLELEQQVAREKDKHQITAQKLLEARGKAREHEEQLQRATAQNAELFAQLDAATRAHADEVARLQHEHREQVTALQRANQSASADLSAKVVELTGQLETATAEWRHTDRQYEQLHKEMLVILDQRDEARRELETIRQRLGLR